MPVYTTTVSAPKTVSSFTMLKKGETSTVGDQHALGENKSEYWGEKSSSLALLLLFCLSVETGLVGAAENLSGGSVAHTTPAGGCGHHCHAHRITGVGREMLQRMRNLWQVRRSQSQQRQRTYLLCALHPTIGYCGNQHSRNELGHTQAHLPIQHNTNIFFIRHLKMITSSTFS